MMIKKSSYKAIGIAALMCAPVTLSAQVSEPPPHVELHMALDLEAHFESIYRPGVFQFDFDYSSSVVLFQSIEERDSYLSIGTKLTERSQAIEALKESLFTVFAYDEPSEAQKEASAARVYDFLQEKNLQAYTQLTYSRNPTTYVVQLGLTQTCSIGGPSTTLVVADEGPYGEPIAYRISSDVCD